MSATSPTVAERVPPHVFFVVSAVFHYLGPSFAVLLFAQLEPSGVAWLRIATAGAVFAVWRRPWRFLGALPQRDRAIVVALGVVLAAMNTVFYEAIARLPLATVGAIEFLGPIGIAAWGVRTRRNLAALALAVLGVCLLTEVRIVSEPLGYEFAFLNCILFMIYILLGHRIAIGKEGASGVDRLAAAMLIATAVAVPTGLRAALPAFADPVLLGAAVGVLRSARDATAAARQLRAAIGAAAGKRGLRWHCGAAPNSFATGPAGYPAGNRRRRLTPGALVKRAVRQQQGRLILCRVTP